MMQDQTMEIRRHLSAGQPERALAGLDALLAENPGHLEIRAAPLAIDSCYARGNSTDCPPGFPKRGQMHVGMGWKRQLILGKD